MLLESWKKKQTTIQIMQQNLRKSQMTHSQSYTDKLESAKQYLKARGIDVTDRNCKFRPTASHDTDIRKTFQKFLKK